MRLKLNGLARWLRHSATGRWLSSHVGAFYMRLVNWTTRWTIEGREKYDQALNGDTGVIAVGWHGRLFMSVFWVPRGRQRRYTVAMISNNRDGDLISALVRRFGVVAVRGSTYDHEKKRDKGGAEAFAGAEKALREQRALVSVVGLGRLFLPSSFLLPERSHRREHCWFQASPVRHPLQMTMTMRHLTPTRRLAPPGARPSSWAPPVPA